MTATKGIEVIDNAGPNHLRGFLRTRAASATKVDIAVAFLTQAGVRAVLPALKKAARHGRVRVLTGLFQGFTEPRALRLLLQAQGETNGRLSVYVSRNPRFHWKAYYLTNARRVSMVVGSSNMTEDGLGNTGELNVVISAPAGSSACRRLLDRFVDACGADNAAPLTTGILERYESFRNREARSQGSRVPLAKILGRARGRSVAVVATDRQYWRDSVSGLACRETSEAVAENTGWDARGYQWYASEEPRHRKGDRIVLFDFETQRAELVEVIDTTRTPSRTPDGQQFTAYRKVRNSTARKFRPDMWRALRGAGLVRSKADARPARKLGAGSFARLVQETGCRPVRREW